MSDEELIAMARLAQRDDRMSTGALYGNLADRIEALGRACTEWAEVSQSNYQRAKAAEAKLEKAVEAVTDAVWMELEDSKANKWTFRKDHIRNAINQATLAGIKGESHV